MWWIYLRIFNPRFLGFGFRGFGFSDLKRPHKMRLQNRMCFTLGFTLGKVKTEGAFPLPFGFYFIKNRFSRLHRFSRLPLKKPIAVPKQKPRALFHWLRGFFSLIVYTPLILRHNCKRTFAIILQSWSKYPSSPKFKRQNCVQCLLFKPWSENQTHFPSFFKGLVGFM